MNKNRSKDWLNQAINDLTWAKEAYIFGSFLSVKFHADSDVDLIVICETQKKLHRTPLRVS